MKKSLIALTVASVAASSAFAVDLDDPTSAGTAEYASEINIAGTGIEVVTTETASAEVGFSVTDATSRYFNFTLTNGGSYVDDPSIAFTNTTCTGAATGGQISITKSAGGGGSDLVLFEVATDPGTVICNDATVALSFNAGTDPNLGLAGTTSISYTLYSNPDQTGVLATAGPNVLATFDNATSVGVATVLDSDGAENAVEAPKLIEVADDSLNFQGGGLFTALGTIYATLVPAPIPTLADGSTPTYTSFVATHEIIVDGDFSAAENVFLFVDDGTATCATAGGTVPATINTALDQAVFAPTVTAGGVGTLTTDGPDTGATICLEVDGTTVIEEGPYMGTYDPVAQTGFTVDTVMFDLATLGNTGTTIEVNLTLTPSNAGGVYRNLIRVTNPTSTTGRVFMRMINDAGESSPTVDLGEVTGGSNLVVGQGSSPQMNINTIYDAVRVADPTFEVGAAPSNKLRTIITGEFGDMDVQTYTVSQDSNSFSTF